MTSQSKPASQGSPRIATRDWADYGIARLRDQVFDAVLTLWYRRKAEGWTQKQVAAIIDRDPAWVSRNLRAPGNWTMRIAGELIQALQGEAEIRVVAVEDTPDTPSNYDAYEGYMKRPPDFGGVNPNLAQITIGPAKSIQTDIRSVA